MPHSQHHPFPHPTIHITSPYTSPTVTFALAPNPNLLLTAFHASTITTYTTVHAATTPHSHPIAPCLNTVLFTTGRYTTGNAITNPADTAPNRNRFCHTVLNTDNGPVHLSGCILNSDRVKCLASHAVTSNKNVSVANVVALARNDTTQLALKSSLQLRPSPSGPPMP